MEADPQSQSSKSLHRTPALQNGRHPLCKGPPEQGGLYVQTRLEGCLPFHPNHSVSSKVPQVCMAGDSLPVQCPSIRTGYSPSGFHEANETSISLLEIKGSKTDCLPGLYFDYWERQGRGGRGISECEEPDGEPGLCDKLREVTSHRHSKNGVFGLHHRFSFNDIRTSQGKSEGDKAEVQMCSSSNNVNNTRAGPPHRDPGSNMIGGNSSAIGLPQSSSTEDRRASPPPLIQIKSIVGATEPDGSGMVSEPPQGSQWKSYSFATSRDDYRIRCFQHRLGGTLE